MRYLLLLLTSLCLATAAAAQGVATFTYQHREIPIIRSKPPQLAPLPWQNNDSTPRESEPAALTFRVDIRPSSALYQQEGWMNLGTMQPQQGILFVFDSSQKIALHQLDYYQPMDIVWVDETGTISSIAPSVVLAEQKETLLDPKPNKALLLLAGGSTEAKHLSIGDKLQDAEFFTTPPVMLTKPVD